MRNRKMKTWLFITIESVGLLALILMFVLPVWEINEKSLGKVMDKVTKGVYNEAKSYGKYLESHEDSAKSDIKKFYDKLEKAGELDSYDDDDIDLYYENMMSEFNPDELDEDEFADADYENLGKELMYVFEEEYEEIGLNHKLKTKTSFFGLVSFMSDIKKVSKESEDIFGYDADELSEEVKDSELGIERKLYNTYIHLPDNTIEAITPI